VLLITLWCHLGSILPVLLLHLLAPVRPGGTQKAISPPGKTRQKGVPLKIITKITIGLMCFFGSISARAAYSEYVCGIYDGTYIYDVAGTYSKAEMTTYAGQFCRQWSAAPAKCESGSRVACKLVSPAPTKPVKFKFMGALDVKTGKTITQLHRPVSVHSGNGSQGGGSSSSDGGSPITTTTSVGSTEASPPNQSGGECTVFSGCTFPNTCENGWCVAPGGGGGECTVFSGCTFPNSCQNGYCIAPDGGGGQCTVFAGCSFPNTCENGWCVAP